MALPLALVLTGCSTAFTNLTPRTQPRNDTGLYPVEVAWDCNFESLKKDTVRATVESESGSQKFKMNKTTLMPNRWETLISVPPGTNVVNYRVRIDFEYYGIPVVKSDSSLSPPYTLRILDK